MTDETTDSAARRMRIGDVERRAMVDALQEHTTAGRLDMAEFERRVEVATAAVYADDLDGLLDDLPPLDGQRPPGADDEPVDRTAWWPRGSGDRPWPSAAGRRGRRWSGVPVPLLVAGVVLLAVVTHGWVLFPLLWFGLAAGMWGRGGRARGGWHGGCAGRRPAERDGHHDRDDDDVIRL